MNKYLIVLLLLPFTNSFAYDALCNTKDGKVFSISVNDKTLKIDYKYSAFYQGKDALGWYQYTNKGYSYKLGKFSKNGLPVKVTNKWGLNTKGWCDFR